MNYKISGEIVFHDDPSIKIVGICAFTAQQITDQHLWAQIKF